MPCCYPPVAESTKPRWRPHTDRFGRPKIRYETREYAMEMAQELSDRDLYNGTAFSRTPVAYPCSDPECGGWHTGNWSDGGYLLGRSQQGPSDD